MAFQKLTWQDSTNGSYLKEITENGIPFCAADMNRLENAIADQNEQLAGIKNKQLLFVSYEQFGAPLNGIDDDTPYVISAHNYANANNIPVIQKRGTIYLRSASKIIVKTSMDLTGSKLLIDASMSNNILYSVEAESGEQQVPASSIIKSQFTKGTARIPCLAGYKNSIFTITSTQILGNRDRDSATPFYKQEPFTIDNYGNIIDGGLLFDYTDSTATLTIMYKSTVDTPLTIGLPHIIVNTTDKNKVATLMSVNRCNVRLKDLTIEVQNMPYADTVYTFKNTLLALKGYNVWCENFNGINLSATIQNSTSVTQGCYIIAWTHASNCGLEKSTLTDGWGVTNSQFVKKLSYRDCTINRIDNHFGMSDMYIDNITFVGDNIPIRIGCGNGIVNISNIKHIITSTTNVGANSLLLFRSDLGLIYTGSVKIENLDIDIKKSSTTEYTITDCSMLLDKGYQCDLSISLPSVELKNITVYSDPVQNLALYGTFCKLTGTTDSSTGYSVMLGEYKYDTIKLNNESITRYIIPLWLDNELSQELLYYTPKYNKYFLQILGCGTYGNPVADYIYYTVIKNVSLTSLLSVNIEDSILRTIRFENATIDTLSYSNVVNKLHIRGNAKLNDAVIYKSDVKGVYFQNRLLARDSNIAESETYSSCSYIPSECYNCTVTPLLSSDSQKTQLKIGNNQFYNCRILRNSEKPVYLELAKATSTAVLLNNICEGAAFDTSTARSLLSYIGTGYSG